MVGFLACPVCVFFFSSRRRHTRFKCDWSSDVCSSDLVAAWRASGITTPLFCKTSCGVAYAHAAPDYNGHWGVREICDIFPTAQQQRCAADHRQPAPADMDRVLAHLRYTTPYLIAYAHVWTNGLGEQR